MVQHGPRAAVAYLHRGEVDRVEVDVVLAHELVQADVLLVEPPLLPLWCVVRSDTGVTDTRVELDSV